MLTRQLLVPTGQRWAIRALLIVVLGFGPASFGQDGLRHLHVGDAMPEFSLAGPDGTVFRYEHGRERVLGLIILQAGQTHLDRVMADLQDLVPKIRSQGVAFDCIGVMCGPGAAEYVRSHAAEVGDALALVADPGFSLWGKLGVIAAPTAVVAGADHKVRWLKAGYGYDFIAGLHAQLSKALGSGGSPEPSKSGMGFQPVQHRQDADAAVRVETLENTSSRARRDRHIQMARTLARKGRWELAVQELEKLRQLDPNAVDVALELAEVLCRAGRNEAALKVAAQIKADSSADKAQVLLITAWAQRQAGDTQAAESLLTRALELVPESPRILYELGKVYQTRGDGEKAFDCYRRALAGVFGDADAVGSSRK
jgi:Flp pilus assembly protein TadD